MKIRDILRKLGYNSEAKAVVLNAPGPIEDEFKKIGFSTAVKGSEKFQFTILFVKNRSEVEEQMKLRKDNIEYDSLFWIAYPKGGSSIGTDINRDKLWELLKPRGLWPVSLVAIDKDRSAMRFRPAEKVKSRK